jgi:uncharacterized membrane protein (UPF0127 family)
MYRLLHNATFHLFLIWLALAGSAFAQGQGQPKLPTVPLSIGKHMVIAEVAASADTRERGLMFRYEMKDNEGMLFVFPAARQQSFWMKNTPLPLSIAFIDAKGTILNIRDMMPFTTDGHPSDGEALYALEVNRGWFTQRGIKAGDRVQGLDKAGKGH